MNEFKIIENDVTYIKYKGYMNRLKEMKRSNNYNKLEFDTVLTLAKMTWKNVRYVKERKKKYGSNKAW